MAVALGVAAGRADARAGRPPYLYALLLGSEDRGRLVRSALGDVANMLLVGILLDSVCQWLILGASYLGAALVVGPVLIAVPYAAARALANRVTTASRGAERPLAQCRCAPPPVRRRAATLALPATAMATRRTSRSFAGAGKRPIPDGVFRPSGVSARRT